MRKIILSLSGCLLSISLLAQITIDVYPPTLQYSLEADLTDEYSEPIAHSWVINTSNQVINLRWEIEVPWAECSSEWKYKVCDKNQCYSSNVTTNVNVGGQPNVPVVLNPGDTSIIDVHINPRFVAGCCNPVIHFSEVTNPNSPVALEDATYEICISALSSVNEAERLSLRAYPNPTLGQFSITNNPLVKKVVLYNILGKQVKSFQHMNGNQYDISGVPDGLYLVSMLDAKGQTLKTVRMTKRAIRP